jgi:hypothetical protein
MSVVALTAPTTFLTDPQFSKTTSNVPGTTGTAVSGNTGFTVPWAPNMCVQVYTGVTACGTVTLVSPNSLYANITVSPGTSANIVFGPFAQFWANAGLVSINVQTPTTVVVNAFLLPYATGTQHNPFEWDQQVADY